MKPYVLVLGVSVYDIFGFTDCNYREKDSNPGRVCVSFGGVSRNIAENMARVGVSTKYITVVGDDEKGKSLLEDAKCKHMDVSDALIIEGGSTPTYMAILDDCGELRSAIVDMKIADEMTTEFVDSKAEIIKNAEYMVLDVDNPKILEYILTNFKGTTKFIVDSVSASKVLVVKDLIHDFHTFKPNRHEAEVLCGFEIRSKDDVRRAGKYFRDLGIENVFISLDADGIYYNNGVEEGIMKANEIPVVNVTGAGDSCVAGLVQGYMNEMSIQDTVKYAIAMSAITISHEQTIHPDMGYDLVQQYLDTLEWCEEKF